jgi:uncharacterized protein (TIGR03083 family)
MTAGPTEIPSDIVATLVGVWQAWSELGHRLTEAQWKTPTDLPAWSVQDTLSHLIGIERLLEGLPAAPSRQVPAGTEPHVRNTIGAFNENEVVLRRALAGATVLDEWDELVARRARTLADAEPAYFAQPMITPVGPGNMTDFLSIRILDCWVHEQDARRALDLPGNDASQAAGHSIDRLLRSLPMVVGKRAACPEGRAVVLDLTGPVRRSITCEVEQGRAAVVTEPARAPLASIEMDSPTYVILANGRRPVDDVADRVTVTAAEPGGDDVGWRVVGGLNVMM